MCREDRVWSLCVIVVAGFVLAVGFHYVQGFYWGKPYPFNTFLFLPADAQNDFYNIFRLARMGDPYQSELAVYFPFTYFPLMALCQFPERIVLALLVLGFTAVLASFIWYHLGFLPRSARLLATLVLAVPTYPYLICVDRGNLEMLVFILTAGFLAGLLRGRPGPAAALLAGAVAMKAYPALFGLLLIQRRHFKAAIGAVLGVLLLTLLGFAVLPGGMTKNSLELWHNLQAFKALYLDRGVGLRFNSSLFGLIKVSLILLGRWSPQVANVATPAYVLLASGVGLFLSYFIVFKEKSTWRQTALVAVAILILPQVSSDYKLICILLPMALFLSSTETSRFDFIYVLLFGLMLIPKSYLVISGDVRLSVLLEPIFLTSLGGLILYERLTANRNEAVGSLRGMSA